MPGGNSSNIAVLHMLADFIKLFFFLILKDKHEAKIRILHVAFSFLFLGSLIFFWRPKPYKDRLSGHSEFLAWVYLSL